MWHALWVERGRYGEIYCSCIDFACAGGAGFLCYMLAVSLTLTVFVFLQVSNRGTVGRGRCRLGS
jgi:hypothetical protein